MRNPGTPSIAALLALLLALPLGAADLATEAPDRAAMLGRELPELTLSSLHGEDMSFAAAEGSYLLLAMADRDSKQEAIGWFEDYAEELARADGLVVYNLLFPGGVSFMVPRGVVVRRIREDVDSITARAREGLPPELRPRFDARRMLWHVDWDRELLARLHAPRHRLGLLLADPTGTLVLVEDRVDRHAIDRILNRVRLGELTSGGGASGEAP